MSYVTMKGVLTTAVAAGGTFNVSYPTGIEGGMFVGGDGAHQLNALGATLLARSAHFSVSLGAAAVTVTLGTGRTTLPAGTEFTLQLQRADNVGDPGHASVPPSVLPVGLVKVTFGLVDAADADGISESQSVTASEAAVLDGVISDVYSGANVVLDTPRNVVGSWTGTAVVTFTGKDQFGNVMVEASASGTSHTGSKAFKEITSIVPSGNITAATFGTGVKLGLPFFLGSAADIVSIATDGTGEAVSAAAAGATGTPSATTGDVRGTITFTTAPNAAKAMVAVVIADPTNRGRAHYAG